MLEERSGFYRLPSLLLSRPFLITPASLGSKINGSAGEDMVSGGYTAHCRPSAPGGPHTPSPIIYRLDHRVSRHGLQCKRTVRSWRRAGRRGRESAVSIGVQKPTVPATTLTLNSGLGFCAGEAEESTPQVLWAFNGRFLMPLRGREHTEK